MGEIYDYEPVDSYYEDMPAPIDSYDCYAMGLRAARCNGCEYAKLKHELDDKFLTKSETGWPTVYELDAEPSPGQGEPTEHEGRPIRFRASFMSIGHSDECYHWKPPKINKENQNDTNSPAT